MKTPRLCIALALLALSPFAFAQAPVCDVTCAPDPGGAGYDNTVDAMTKVQNMRGTQTVYAPETAGSQVTYHATGTGKNQAQGKIVAGSSSYSYSIPILSLPGRNRLDLNLTLHYNSAIWNANSDTLVMTFNADRDFPSYGFRLGFGFLEKDATHNKYTLVESDNSKRQLTPSSSVYVSTDSSFIQYDPGTNVVTYKNGTRVFYELFPGQTKLWRPKKIEDTNGNFISISYRTDSWAQGQEIDTITDTLGRQIVFSYDATTHELIGIAQGAQQYVSLAWNNTYTLQYNFSGWTVQNSPANNSTQKVLNGITYPGNGTGYSLIYGGWGIINTIQFGPSGGSVVRNSVSYNYPPGTTAQNGGPWFSQQTVFDGVNTYNWQYSKASGSSAITDPYGTKRTTTFSPITGLRTSIVISSGITTLRTIANTWNAAPNPTIANTTTTLGDTSQQSKVTFSYDTYKNVSEVNEYDYGLVYKRRTHTDYMTSTNYPNHITAHILDRPTNVYVYDESGAESLKQRTDVVYDENPPTSPYGIPTQWDSAVTGYRGNVTTIKRYEDPIGLSGEIDRHFQYDVAGNLIQADLDCCTSKTWKYDSTTDFAYPTQVISGTAPQLTTNMTYYPDSGLLHTYSDENGQQTTYSFDAMFRLTNVQRPDLVNYGTSYDDTQALQVITNTSPVDSGITVKTIVQLDGAGRVKKQTVKDNNQAVVSIVDTAYDALGRRTSVSNPYSTGTPIYTQFSYDALSRILKIIPPDGSVASNNTQYSYSGNTVTVTDPASKQRRDYVDAMGRLVRVDEPGGSTATGSVTITGTERWICDPNGPPPPQCVKIYDIGNVTITVNGFGKTVGYSRTSTPTSLATAFRSAFNNDPNSPVTAAGTGAAITFTSVLSGNAVNYSFSVTAQTLDTTDFFGSSFNGSPTSGSLTGGSDNGSPATLAHPFAAFYSYDIMNNLIQVNQGAQQRNYVYNGLWRLTSAQTPESGTATYSYQNGGAPCSSNLQNVCQRTDARNVVTTYAYDTLNRLTGLSYSDGTPSVTYSYDAGGSPAYALGRLTSMTDGTGSETYTYDQFGRIRTVAKVISGTAYNVGYVYDYIGDLKSLTYPDNSVVNQSYDAVGRLAQISSAGTNYLTVPSGSYNAASLPTMLTYGSGVQATIGYNARFQLGTLDYKLGTTDLLNLTYNYNQTVGGNTVNNGQIQGITDTRGNAFSTSYTYDALGRLSQGQTLDLTAANTWKIGWVYDRYGNRSQQNLLGGTISTTAPQLTIDPASNRITTSGFQYDGAGDLTADGGVHSYAYDGENLVKSVDSTAATYAYNGKGMRVKKVVGTTTTAYIFSGSKVIAEYTNGALTAKYVYAGGQLLATVAGGVTYHYPDHLSPRLETNATGTVTRTFGHLPFGETWYETGSAIKWKFTSYERDAESGLDYSIFRYDSSRLGRFMTRDPLAGSAADPQSLNRYSYVGNDPANFIDPLGLGVCPYLAPDQGDNCGGGEGGDAGGGGGYVDGSWTIGSLFSPSVGGSIPTWGPVWVPYSNSGVYVDGEFTINATTGYWTVGFLGFSSGTTGSVSGGGGSSPANNGKQQPTSKKAEFSNCVKQTLSATLPQTAREFGQNLKRSVKIGVPLGLGIGGAILFSEPEFLPVAPAVLAVSTGETVSTFATISTNIFLIRSAADIVGGTVFCAINTF